MGAARPAPYKRSKTWNSFFFLDKKRKYSGTIGEENSKNGNNDSVTDWFVH